MSAKFTWERWFHKEHDDLCRVESRNYVLEQHIKALERALREIAHPLGPYSTGELRTIARKALRTEKK